jgi:hypothetical protein
VLSLEPLIHWFRERLAAGQIVWEMGGEGEGFLPLSDEVSVIDLDLEQLQSPEFARRVLISPLRDGQVNAVVLVFRLELAPGVILTTSGRTHAMHWSKPVYMLPSPIELHSGEPVELQIRYETQGEIMVSLGPI